MTPDTKEDLAQATLVATLAEGVAVLLIFAAAFVWMAIYATRDMPL